eukprot:scaffold203_cov386-Prasinococcus_capsulatus_cf.AAC.5
MVHVGAVAEELLDTFRAALGGGCGEGRVPLVVQYLVGMDEFRVEQALDGHEVALVRSLGQSQVG